MAVIYNIEFIPAIGSSTLIEYRKEGETIWIVPSSPSNPTSLFVYPLTLDENSVYYVRVSSISASCGKSSRIILVNTSLPGITLDAISLNSVTGTGFIITSEAEIFVDWGDGTIDTFAPGTVYPTHEYVSPYTGIIEIKSSDLSAITQFEINGNTEFDSYITPFSDALSITTSELSKLIGLTVLSLNESIFTDGIITDLPNELLTLTITNTNLSGNVNNLARTLTYINIQGVNTISGEITGLPSELVFLVLWGYNTLNGDISNVDERFPENITTLQILGNNTITGDIQYLPANLLVLDIEGSNTLFGDVNNLPIPLVYFVIYGANTISGDIANLPVNLTKITLIGTNTITGDIANINTSMVEFQVLGTNTLFGDLALIPDNILFFNVISSQSSIDSYTPGTKTWLTTMTEVRADSGIAGFDTTEVDNILIELAAQVTSWTGDKIVSFQGVSAPRSAASDTAVLTLEGLGVTVITN